MYVHEPTTAGRGRGRRREGVTRGKNEKEQ